MCEVIHLTCGSAVLQGSAGGEKINSGETFHEIFVAHRTQSLTKRYILNLKSVY